ncbi:hypothetical protein K1W69_21205 [Hoeflea sp. WL0058]|uniref:Uncharacterized protein n=1 Tax=Flavimaribacter sediminis TaxID=2865987 RepID=A0AAE3D3E6_9HYPH|nr:hypothetical protein [Flavimaribacter sediminis]MBW8639726.1 hypothetical protein [Flavimaribacter sediminis]
MRNIATITFASLLLGLAACSDSGETETSSTDQPVTSETTSAMETTEPVPDASDNTVTGSISSDAAMASNVPDVAVDACLNAVQMEASATETDVIGAEYSEANSIVTVGVGAEKTPWRCLVSNEGQVAEVTQETN